MLKYNNLYLFYSSFTYVYFFQFCKYFMVKFCPHDLFVNTRADLGACPKVHCEEAKTQYNEASSRSKMQYEDEFVSFATSLLNDVDRRIEKGKQRLELMNKTEMVSIPYLLCLKLGTLHFFM